MMVVQWGVQSVVYWVTKKAWNLAAYLALQMAVHWASLKVDWLVHWKAAW